MTAAINWSGAWWQLVRGAAVLSVPGDVLAGSAAAGWPARGRTGLLAAASAAFYWAGMVLNDWADRHTDAVERPERPIPSGRVAPSHALGGAVALTGLGLGLAAAGGGLRIALPLAGAVWLYDTGVKTGPAGPVVMATARGLDVLMATAGRPAAVTAALPAAAVVAAHTLGVTVLSRGEVHGTTRAAAAAALTATVGAAGAVLAVSGRRPGGVAGRAATWSATGLYLAGVGLRQAAAVRDPSPGTVRTATGAGIQGLVPLQAALLSAAGAPRVAIALVVAATALARAARRVSWT